MSMYTTAQLLAANEQKFKFDPLFLRLFFRESYPFTTEKVYLSQIPGLVNMALYVSPIVSGEVTRGISGDLHGRRRGRWSGCGDWSLMQNVLCETACGRFCRFWSVRNG